MLVQRDFIHFLHLILGRRLDLLVCVVLAQRVHSPNRSRNPTYERQLQEQAEKALKGASDREEHHKRMSIGVQF